MRLDVFQNFIGCHVVNIEFTVGRQTGVRVDGLVSG
jgi:hypothetical protein